MSTALTTARARLTAFATDEDCDQWRVMDGNGRRVASVAYCSETMRYRAFVDGHVSDDSTLMDALYSIDAWIR